MKKMLAGILAAAMAFSLAACGNDSNSSETTAVNETTVQTETTAAPTETTEAAPETAYEVTDTRVVSWTDSIGSVWVQAIVEITNTGSTNLFLSSGSFDLEDADGNLVDSCSMASTYPNVIAPGEKGYMYEETILDNPVDGELTVIPRLDIEEATVDLIRYDVTDAKLSEGKYGDLRILGRVQNNTEEAGKMTYVVAILYDADGVCIGQMFTILTDDLAAGEQRGFEMSAMSLPDSVTVDAVANIVYYAYPMQMQF